MLQLAYLASASVRPSTSDINALGRQASLMKEPIMSLSFVYAAPADFHTSHQLTGTRMGSAGLQKIAHIICQHVWLLLRALISVVKLGVQSQGANLLGVLENVSILRDSQGCEPSNLLPLLLELCAGTVEKQF